MNIPKGIKFRDFANFGKFTKCLKGLYKLSRNFVLANSFCNYNSQNFVLAKPISKPCFFELKISK